MAADRYCKPYLESSVWIGWIKGEVVNGIERAKIAEHILTQAEGGVFPIFTSTLTLAEVHRRRGSDPLSTPEDEQVLAYFEHDFIRMVDVDKLIGQHANAFCRDTSLLRSGSRHLRPNDAIHLACALRAGCDFLLTWDDGLLNCNHSDIVIAAPEIKGQQTIEFNP